jgi:acetoin utilization deacetylase AcuC-like enzyme
MAGAPVFLSHPSSLEHDTGAHPEAAARITAIELELSSRGWLGYERIASPAVERETLEAIHPRGYVHALETACRDGTRYLDVDTVISAGSCEAALHGSGGAVRLVDLLLEGSAPTGFSAHRPPGHHAERARGGGFCLFNHVSVAAQHALDRHGLERVMIFDWDVHHGNGTNDIFHSSRQVLYVSIHQSPLYPGTGPASDTGSGQGQGFTVNMPVPPGAGDAVFRSLADDVVVPLANAFEPQLVLVSAGYDAHAADPLANCLVTDQGFGAMAKSMAVLGAELEVPIGAVLEGGYALGPLARLVAVTMETLAGPLAGREPPPEMHPLARATRERISQWWPALAPA